MSTKVRLNKYIADAGLASRRQADKLISSGHVIVNSKKIFELGTRVDPLKDRILVDKKPIKMPSRKVYYAFFKPKHVVTTLKDPQGRVSLADYFKKERVRLFPVGRLDWATEGLLLITNDGAFSQKVTHPKHAIPKTYLAKLNGQPTGQELQVLCQKGVTIPGGRVSALHISKCHKGSREKQWVRIIIAEGRNKQIHHMFNKIGYDVIKLQRTAIGKLKLPNIQRGQYKELKQKDLKKVFEKPHILLEKSIKKRQKHKNPMAP